MIPGSHVAMPDGRHVWEYAAQGATDLAALVKAAAVQVLPDATLTAAEQRAMPGEGARLVTTLTRHPGGASVQVHARMDHGAESSFCLVYDAVVTRSGSVSALPGAVAAGAAVTAANAVAAEAVAAQAESQPDDAAILHDNLAAGAGALSFATSILADVSLSKAAAFGVISALGALGFRTGEGALDNRSRVQRDADAERYGPNP